MSRDRGRVFDEIADGTITIEKIESSDFYNKIEQRVHFLPLLEQMIDSNDTVFKYNKKANMYSMIDAVQFYAEPYIVANVPPNCFMPRPNVGSAVIRLTSHKKPVAVKNEKLMFDIIRASFNQRRKTLVNGLYNVGGLNKSKEELAAVLESIGLAANVRGETLTLEQFAALSDALSKSAN